MKFMVIAIILSCCFYSFAVAHSFRSGLKKINLSFFVAGFAFDYIGTSKMFFVGNGLILNFHGLCGIAGLVGMGIHTLVAIILYLSTTEQNKQKVDRFFHYFSLTVYSFWLLAFISGVLGHIPY
ncbi:MAG: TIGR03987 family protein [Candidatus Portnoybacteria bacterium CG_4_8_14_3_um_filter_44_10]|uniref:TIGR03987 family protein n=5 Tax=Candidatus Portnoyibacteriota TaxID=1817913 RepID=A0A2H0KQZ7_9BACT|nr:MAG: TIGR03987 family protein [Candidatus Portnoybacteria bacterium CG11_big_fil_rev_8_21_14_0_20_44_10]PIS17010.1 MAG: TIGR03987 family protein [Candidatus Portnoybacteria bacterium CG09_land_8_20_14_0_10_44_13]PIW75358.1 MAG: TIGR03987 family protein [Candidatus Portnoybacteria bacterium CG_4_8_14_3_um_filter_44_10]PIZ71308.1 MAG: TIGR03987 family protein [Candidatus Portnoybacteria bacterium CG_4_10_14_0_2_um_filter_44_20]PJA62840.1 MAG: TIGR03987 family protein [Candidatus Portnoybacteri